MKKLSQQLEDLLQDYLDGTLEPGAKAAFEEQLTKDSLLAERLQEMKNAISMLQQLMPEQPSRNFTHTVMNRLDQYPLQRGLSIKNGIMLLTGVVIIMVVATILISTGVFDQTTTLDLNQIGVVQRYLKQSLPGISINGKVVVNVIIVLNLALAFVLLDRTILKPLFQRRMQAGQ